MNKRYNYDIKKMTFSLVVLLVGMLVLLVSTSYAWMTVSSLARVSDMTANINAPNGVELSLDQENWALSINLSDTFNDDSILKPVTYSKNDDCFKTIKYCLDGRQSDTHKSLNDDENANGSGDNQYYYHTKFYVRTDSSCELSLSEALELNDGEYGSGTYVVGSPVWDGESNNNEGNGGEYAIRIGFKVSNLNATTSEFYIYEPNADVHADKTVQYLDTKSCDGYETLTDEDHLIIQSTSTWTDLDIAEENVTIKELGEFQTDTFILDIENDEIKVVDLYIWLEGNDIDCYALGSDCKILANIQFSANYNGKGEIVETY